MIGSMGCRSTASAARFRGVAADVQAPGSPHAEQGDSMSEATPTLETVQDELIAIRRQLAAAEQRAQQAEQRVQLIETIVHDMPVGVSIWHQDDPDDPCSFRLISANP